ncbi:TetR family transcriptional regulator [Cohnella sp. GCM10020058]|uniref:TetR family transcriptional regulator n=1 Tax=Cohnella sp. GCM10020058 TaxID=3317330 RepID=UPI00363F8A4D
MLVTTNYQSGADFIAHDESDSREKLMQAAIDLMADKGFKGVSTKEIAAAAGVSEMTLFRRFGTKLTLLEQAVEQYHYAVEMTSAFEENIVWHLGEDLRSIGRVYHEIMARNRKLYLIVLKDDALAGVREKAQRHPKKMLELLTDYLNEMRVRGKLVETDTQMQAMTFMWMHFGAFVSRLYGGGPSSEASMADVIESSAALYEKAWTPRYDEWGSDKTMDMTLKHEAESPVGKTKDAGYQIGMRRTLPVTVEEAWRYLTGTDGLRVWLGEAEDVVVREGENFATREGNSGRFTVVKPLSHVRLQWMKSDWEAPSTLQIRVLAAKQGATISIHQEKLSGPAAREEMKAHWEGVQEAIRLHLEGELG